MGRSWGVVLALVAVGCGPRSTDTGTALLPGSPAGSPSTGTPGTTPTGPYLRCAVQADNPLRFDCDGRLAGSGTAQVWVENPDGTLRELALTQTDDTVAFTVWKLRPQTAYTVRLSAGGVEQQADLETGEVPAEFRLAPVLTGTASFDEILVPFQCAGTSMVALLDTDGTMLWYQPTGDNGSPFDLVDGFDAGPDGVTAVVGRNALRSWSWDGTPTFDLALPGALPSPVHHDALVHDGHIFVLSADQVTGADGNPYVMDGVLVYALDGSLVASWSLADVYEPTGFTAGGGFWGSTFPDAQDWAHTNGIEIDGNGDWLLSSKRFDTVIKVRGDWTAPDFGEVLWGLSADPSSELGSDFAFQGGPAPVDFQDQHHPNFDDQGRLLLFDNRVPFVGSSRATVWELDETALTATLVHAWELDESCPVQGAAFPLANEHVVATCASAQRVYEFLPGQAEPMWTMTVACAETTARPLLVRAMPQPMGD